MIIKNILIISACILILFGCQTKKEEIEDFTNKSYEEAISYCEENKISYTISYVYNDEVEKGNIISQEMITEDKKESNFSFIVSKGHKPFYADDFTGISEEELIKNISELEEKYYLYNGKIKYIENCDDDTGVVISQSPKNEQFDEPVEITYLVSKKSDKCQIDEETKANKSQPATQLNSISNGNMSITQSNNSQPELETKETIQKNNEQNSKPVQSENNQVLNNSNSESQNEPVIEETTNSSLDSNTESKTESGIDDSSNATIKSESNTLPPIEVDPIPDEDYAPANGGGSITIIIPVPTEEDLKNAPDLPEGTIVYG